VEVTAYIYTRAPELHKFNYRMGIPVPSDRRAIVDQLSRGHDLAFASSAPTSMNSSNPDHSARE